MLCVELATNRDFQLSQRSTKATATLHRRHAESRRHGGVTLVPRGRTATPEQYSTLPDAYRSQSEKGDNKGQKWC